MTHVGPEYAFHEHVPRAWTEPRRRQRNNPPTRSHSFGSALTQRPPTYSARPTSDRFAVRHPPIPLLDAPTGPASSCCIDADGNRRIMGPPRPSYAYMSPYPLPNQSGPASIQPYQSPYAPATQPGSRTSQSPYTPVTQPGPYIHQSPYLPVTLTGSYTHNSPYPPVTLPGSYTNQSLYQLLSQLPSYQSHQYGSQGVSPLPSEPYTRSTPNTQAPTNRPPGYTHNMNATTAAVRGLDSPLNAYSEYYQQQAGHGYGPSVRSATGHSDQQRAYHQLQQGSIYSPSPFQQQPMQQPSREQMTQQPAQRNSRLPPTGQLPLPEVPSRAPQPDARRDSARPSEALHPSHGNRPGYPPLRGRFSTPTDERHQQSGPQQNTASRPRAQRPSDQEGDDPARPHDEPRPEMRGGSVVESIQATRRRADQRSSENMPVRPNAQHFGPSRNSQVQIHRAAFERLHNARLEDNMRAQRPQTIESLSPPTVRDTSNRPRTQDSTSHQPRSMDRIRRRMQQNSSGPIPPVTNGSPPAGVAVQDNAPRASPPSDPRLRGGAIPRPSHTRTRRRATPAPPTLATNPPRDAPSTALALDHANATTSVRSPLTRPPTLARQHRRVSPRRREQENVGVEETLMREEVDAVLARYGVEEQRNETMDETPPRVGRVERRMADM